MPLSLAIIVVVLPLVMFLFLGLAGVKMGRKITGVIGVLAMLVDTILAYGVALTYFFGSGQGQMVDGVRQAVVVANPAWLSFTDTLVVRMGVLVDPIAAMMQRREGIPALLCLPGPVHVLDAGSGGCHQHLPDFRIL